MVEDGKGETLPKEPLKVRLRRVFDNAAKAAAEERARLLLERKEAVDAAVAGVLAREAEIETGRGRMRRWRGMEKRRDRGL